MTPNNQESKTTSSETTASPIPNKHGQTHQENLPANVPPPASGPLAAWGNDQPSYLTNLPQVTEDEIVRVAALMAESTRKSKQCAGMTLPVVGFAIDYGPVGETADGEIVEGVRGH